MKPLFILIGGITLTVLLLIGFIILNFCSTYSNPIATGTFVILGVTLIVIMIYAYDTNRLANLQQNIYLTPNVIHQIDLIEVNEKNINVGLDLINFSNFYVSALTFVQLKCFEQELFIPNEIYYGKSAWNLPPNLKVHGHFTVNDDFLKPANINVDELRKAADDPKALSLNIKINCKSIHGIELSIPETKYFYSFKRKTWVLIV